HLGTVTTFGIPLATAETTAWQVSAVGTPTLLLAEAPNGTAGYTFLSAILLPSASAAECTTWKRKIARLGVRLSAAERAAHRARRAATRRRAAGVAARLVRERDGYRRLAAEG